MTARHSTSEIRMIPVDQIDVLNPRERNARVFGEIVGNIKALGLKKPITVTPRATDSGERFLLVCGEGRLTAFRTLGETEIPALVIDVSDEDAFLMSLAENIARRQSRPLEILAGIGQLMDKGYTPKNIAAKTGLTMQYVQGILTLLEQGEERLLDAVGKGHIPLNAALTIVGAGDDDKALQSGLQDAYESGKLRGKQLMEVRRIIEKRQVLGNDSRQHLLLDGHIRLIALRELGYTDAPCLIAKDDESYTYNTRINRISTIQEHFMIRRAIDRGVSPNRAGLQLTGTWPLRTELGNRVRGMESNALASSIVLVCRKRPTDAPSISRREFIRELNGVLPEALDEMTKGSGDERSPVAPVDLSQAIIGPDMAVFSKYAAVLEADGSPMSVRTALQLINRFLAEDDFDADTQFCLHWFEQHGWNEGIFGTADTLARGKGTSVDGIKEAGVIQSGGGKVRLLKWAEYPTDWDPRTDTRMPVWEALHHLIRALKQGGESASGALLAALGGKAEAVRQLAYRLYTLCERLGQAEDARAYNELITSWTGIESAANSVPKPAEQQARLDF